MAVIVHQEIPYQDWMDDKVHAWAQQEEEARCNSALRLAISFNQALIAIKAQHPLHPDGTPGPEYQARLEAALQLKHDLETKHGTKVTMMTFGDVHEGCESTTLAKAGADWLIDRGVAPDSIIMHRKVYSGNDEDDLAAQEFANNSAYRELHVVLSAGQWERTRLYFIAMGWQPFLHPIVYLDAQPHHSSVCEIWGTWRGSINGFKQNGLEGVREEAEAIRQRHRDELAASQQK